MNPILAVLLLLGGVVALVTCAVLRSRGQEADALADRYFTEQARLPCTPACSEAWHFHEITAADERRRDSELVTALVAEDVVREAERVLAEAR